MRKENCVMRGLIIVVLTAQILVPLFLSAQTNGDYRSAATPVNWNLSTSWEKYNSGWGASPDYPGQASGAGTVTIRDGHTITLNFSPANSIGALTVGEGTSGSLLSDAGGNRTLNVTNALTINAGGSYNLARTILTINGTTTISGSLTDNNNNGSAIFVGLFTVNSGGTFSTANNSGFTFRGGIANDGTFNKTGTGAVTFNTNDQEITCSQAIVLNGVVTVTAINLVNSCTDLSLTRTLSSSLTGTGNWEQGDGSVLKFSGASINCSVDFSSYANTVNYALAGAQSIYDTPYSSLTISGSGTKTLTGAVTIDGNLTLSGTATLACDIHQITGNATGTFTMGASTTLTLGNTLDVTAVLFPANFINANISLNSTSTVTYQSLDAQTISTIVTYGRLTIAGGGTKTINGNLTVAGNLTISAGTLDLGTTATTVSVTGTAAVTGTLSFNGTTTKTVTITGSLSGAGTIDMSGGSLLHSLTLSGASNAIGTLTTDIVASIITYNATVSQQVFASDNYRNLIISGNSTKTLQGGATVNGDFTLNTTATFNPAGQNLSVNGITVIAGTFADGTIAGTTSFENVDFSGGTINAAQSGVININGNLSIPTGNGTIGRVNLTVTGTTTIGTTRTLTLNSNTGVKRFDSEITIQGSGSWTSTTIVTAANLDIRGGINVVSASGGFTAAAAIFNANQNLSGAGPISFSSAVSIGVGQAVTNLNTYGITFTNTFSGLDATASWIQGANAIIYYRPAVATQPMNTGTLVASGIGNQFHYSLNNTQTIKVPSTSYYHLYVTGGAGTKTLGGSTLVDGDFNLAASTTFAPSTFDFTVSGTSTVAGTISDASATGTSTFLHVDLSGGTITGALTGIFSITGNLTMPSGNGILGRAAVTVSGGTTVPNGYSLTLNDNNGVKRFDGLITLNGTGTFTSTTISTATNLDLRGGITVSSASGSFAAGAAIFNASQNITGAGALSFTTASTIAAGVTVTNTNTAGVTFNGTITGGDAASVYAHGVNGITYYQPGATTAPMLTGILEMSASVNTFHYSSGSSNQNIKAPQTSYYNLVISGGSSRIKTLLGNTTADGTLSISASTTMEVAGFDFSVAGVSTVDGTCSDNADAGNNTFSGLLDINATGTLTTANASPFIFEGGITNDGTFSKTGTGAVAFNTNNQDINGTTAITMAGVVTIGSGRTITYKNTSVGGIVLTGILDGTNASSTWKNDVNTTVFYQPNATTRPMNTGILDVSASGNNFYYSRTTGNQTLKSPLAGYYNLIINGGGAITKTLTGNTTVEGNLTIAASTTLDVDVAQNYSLTVKGIFLNSGTFQPRAGTVTLNGTSDQAVTSNGSSFYNLVINNSGTQVLLNDNLTAANALTLTDGIITTSALYRVIMSSTTAASLTAFSTNSFINGNLRRYIGTNTNTYTFPIGDGTANTDYYRADIINYNLAGITYIDSRFKPLAGHNDGEMNVADTWEFGSLTYNTINTEGIWELEPFAQPSSGSYAVRLYTANMSGLTDNDFGPLKRDVGSMSGADWSTGGGTLNPNDGDGRTVASGYMKRNGLTTFSEFGGGGGGSSGGGLPIELVSFNAIAVGNAVQLTWHTATELNNDYFTIERSADGETFTGVQTIEGAGNSSQSRNYETMDLNPISGTSYYRLKQTDYNGAYSYSDVASVVVNKSDLFSISPNPVTESRIALQLNKEEITGAMESVLVTDMSGKTIFTQHFGSSENPVIALELPHEIASGIYLLTVKCLNSTMQKKFLVK